MDNKFSEKEYLIQRIAVLESTIEEIVKDKEKEETLEFAWTGNLGHWYWDVKTNRVVFNPLKVTTLGYDIEEIPKEVGYQFFTEMIHPDDHERTMKAMKDHLHGINSVYEVEYRIKTKDSQWKWFYDRGKITKFDEEGRPLFLAGIVFDITKRKEMEAELERKNKELEKMASTDYLTKLLNRRALFEKLESELKRAARYNTKLSLLLIDIDNFKKVNDNYGHQAGDEVLVTVASILKGNLREIDILGRYGGEEFIIIYPNSDCQDAYLAADRVRQKIAVEFKDTYTVTISGGLKGSIGENPDKLIAAADRLLYEAKRAGKNQIICE